MAPPAPSEIEKRATRLAATAPKSPLLGPAIKCGVGMTGILLALLGYEASLAMFGGLAIATLTWIVLAFREGKLRQRSLGEQPLDAEMVAYAEALRRYGVGSPTVPETAP